MVRGAKYYAFMRTIVRNGEESIFAKRHRGEHFKGPLIPFGALIGAMPRKFEPTMQPAIFLGYVVQPGCRWYREFLYVFLDDLADMSFCRLVRWSRARVPLHSGRDITFDGSKLIVFPCREQYRRDNETLEGIRIGRGAMENVADVCDDDGDVARVGVDQDVDGDGDLAVAEDENPLETPHVDFEPYPQHIADELDTLLNDEADMAQVYDCIPTTVDPQKHAVDQFGVRIQKTTHPPYISLQEWKAATPVDKNRMRADFQFYADRLVAIRQRIADLRAILREYDERGGLRTAGVVTVCGPCEGQSLAKDCRSGQWCASSGVELHAGKGKIVGLCDQWGIPRAVSRQPVSWCLANMWRRHARDPTVF